MKLVKRIIAALLLGIVVAAPAAAQPASSGESGRITQDDPAYKAAFEETLRKPSDPVVLIHYADLANRAGNLEGAISALERLLLIDADQPKIKLELGVLYFRLGSYEKARTYLESAQASGRATEQTRQRAAEFIAQVDQRTRKSRLSGELLAGLRYSTNANSGPSGAISSFGVSTVPTPNISGQPDFSAVAAAAFRHRYDLGRQDNGALETDLALYGSRQFQVTSANVALIDMVIGPRTSPFEGWAQGVTLKPFATARYVAIDDFTNYWAWGMGLEATAPVGPATTAALTVFGRRREYVDNPDALTNSNSTGNEAASVLEFRTVLAPGLTLAFSGNFTRYIAVVGSESYTEFGLLGTLGYRFTDPLGINGRTWQAILAAGVQRAAYDQPDPTVDPSQSRQQNDFSFSFVLSVPLDERFTFVSQTGYTQRDANISNFAYNAFTTLAGVSWRF